MARYSRDLETLKKQVAEERKLLAQGREKQEKGEPLSTGEMEQIIRDDEVKKDGDRFNQHLEESIRKANVGEELSEDERETVEWWEGVQLEISVGGIDAILEKAKREDELSPDEQKVLEAWEEREREAEELRQWDESVVEHEQENETSGRSRGDGDNSVPPPRKNWRDSTSGIGYLIPMLSFWL